MRTDITQKTQLEIIKFLYRFKDDNKFYKLEEDLLNTTSQKEKYFSIHTLRDNALIGTDREVCYSDANNSITDHFGNKGEIKARILPKGIAAVELLLQKEFTV